jgi:hypothetical protein
MLEFLGGLLLGWFASCLMIDILDNMFKSAKFKIGDTVYWRNVEEVGTTNSQWTVTLKSGTVVSCDARVCIEEDNEAKTLVFIEKEKLYTATYKLKRSIGAKLTHKEELKEEGGSYQIL